MRLWTPFSLLLGLASLASTPTLAASLQATPMLFELSQAKATDTLTLRNEGVAPINAQVRVYRWTQANGADKMEITQDVVASPPVVTIAPGADQLIRVVRVSKHPVKAEDTYRIVVDELPDNAPAKSTSVNFLFQYSIPMFVMPDSAAKSNVSWALEKQGEKTYIVAHNDGDRRLRIGGLTLTTADGKEVVLGKGLNGYVLARSHMRWAVPNSLWNTKAVTVTARSDEGPVNAHAEAQVGDRR